MILYHSQDVPTITAKSQVRVATEWHGSVWFARRLFVLLVSVVFCCSAEVSTHECRNVLVPKCVGTKLSRHFGTLDTSALMLKCLGAQMSWVRSRVR